MKALPPYDQRFVRRDAAGFLIYSRNHSLCMACGNKPRCSIKEAAMSIVTRCKWFQPVVSFSTTIGINGVFNTFRRGVGIYNRLNVGDIVRLYATDICEFVGEVQVEEKFTDLLLNLLGRHAAMNHILRDGNYPDADMRLHKILVTLYGRSYASVDSAYSVIYIRMKDG